MSEMEQLPSGKANEPWKSKLFQLETEPDKVMKISLKTPTDKTSVKLEVKNKSDKDQAVKIKCTNNKLFRIHCPPPAKGAVMRLEKGKSATVNIDIKPSDEGLTKAEEKSHRIAVFHLEMGQETDPTKVKWAPNGQKPDKTLEPQKRIPVEFVVEKREEIKKTESKVAKQESKVPEVKKQESKVAEAKKTQSKVAEVKKTESKAAEGKKA